jgi:hypothetical protein
MLPWQFAQFALATQTAALFACYSLGFLTRHKLLAYTLCQTVALLLCFILMFANRMLMTSLFATVLCAVWLVIATERAFELILLKRTFRNPTSWIHVLLGAITRVLALVLFMFIAKKYMLGVLFSHAAQDDSHIWDILKSKFDPSFYTFDTRLYTCAAEFDFLELETLYKLTQTFLLPTAGLVVLFYVFILARRIFVLTRKENELNSDDPIVNQECCLLYNIIQLAAYTIMAGLIMRLKLFWTPYLCVLASCLGNRLLEHNIVVQLGRHMRSKLFGYSKQSARLIVVGLVLACMSIHGMRNVQDEWSRLGEFSEPTQEAMMAWITTETKKSDAFAGSMALMANIRLSTGRPVMNHPHYEDVGVRNRTLYLYSLMYGNRRVEELHRMLKSDYQVAYLVLETHFCHSHQPGKPQCALNELAHIGFERLAGERRVCEVLFEQTEAFKRYFELAFSKNYLSIFKVI